MIIKNRLILFVLFMLILGCSSESDKAASEQSSKTPIFNEQITALEKAKGVEKMLQLEAGKNRQAIDEATK